MKHFYCITVFFLALICSTYAEEDKIKVVIIAKAEYCVCQGEKVNFTIVVKNTGTATAKNVIVRAKIPAGMKYKKYVNGIILRWKLKSLPVKEEKILRYTLNTPKAGIFENIAIVYVDGNASDKVKIQTRIIPPSAPILKMTIDCPSYTFLSVTTFIIRITNEGDASARRLKVIATLPSQLDYIRSTPYSIYRRRIVGEWSTIHWKIPEIKARSKKIIKLVTRAKFSGRYLVGIKLIYNYKSSVRQIIKTFASIFFRYGDDFSMPLFLHSYARRDYPCLVGSQATYLISCDNEGRRAATNIIIKNRLPKKMVYVEAKGPTPHKHKDGMVTFEAVPILNPGKRLNYSITCKAIAPGSAKNINYTKI